jgi:5-methyltetrahydrofolate--homocysteine methyltransferase
MDNDCPKGALSWPGGIIPFGSGKPLLCVNDQCGYLIEKDEVKKALLSGDYSPLIQLAMEGLRNGMPVFNLQLMASSLIDEEKRLFPKVLDAVYRSTGCGIAIDTRDPEVLEQALSQYPHKAMCNCINGEKDNLETFLPIIKKYGGAIGTALVDEEGIPETLEKRKDTALRIRDAAEAAGIPREDIIMDGVCLPSGVVPDSMRLTLQTLRMFQEELGVPTLLGSSNAGYMMPNPHMIDSTYLIAAASWGLNVAMISPATPHIRWTMASIDFLMGTDPYAERYLALYREEQERETTEAE